MNYKQKGCYGSIKKDGLTKFERYYRRHREKRLKYNKEYRKSHKKENARRMREYRKKNPEKFKKYEINRKRPVDYREKLNKYCKEWKKKNPDKRLASYQKRRASYNGDISGAELLKLRKSQNGICFYCGEPLDNNGRGHLDHKQPIIRGGRHEIANVAFACSDCNLRKGRKTEKEFKCAS